MALIWRQDNASNFYFLIFSMLMTVEHLQDEIKSHIVVVDFMATRCVPCQAMYPVVKELADHHNVRFIKLDADEHEAIFDQYEVYGVPHIKIFVNGEEKASSTGPKQREDIETMIVDCVNCQTSQEQKEERILVEDYF